MTEQENINNEVQRKLALQDAKFNQFMDEMRERDKIRAEEMRDFKQEMRDRDNRRADEIAEIRKSVASIQESGKNQTIVTFLGIAAMVIAVLLK